jgi:hypothetical protein
MTTASSPPTWRQRAEPWLQALLRAFHRYANWLVSISWKRFIFLSLLLLILTAILQNLPPFSWKVTETVIDDEPEAQAQAPKPPKPSTAPRVIIDTRPEAPASAPKPDGIAIEIDERGVRIGPKSRMPGAAASAASAASAPAAAGSAAEAAQRSIEIKLPPGATREVVREVVDEVRAAVQEALDAEREALQSERAALEEERHAVEQAATHGGKRGPVLRTRIVQWGDFLPELAFLWIVASAIVKASYKGRIQAEVKAAQATEAAEAESLKRQVVEARMAAMQAQVEPHFLFNTLASIDHLIETDPARASLMQRNLIALLRASMPTMREANASAPRELKRELDVIRPYLEILKVRMEERLAVEIDVPEGLQSAEFPPMMIQGLVENAIKHGLEPKPEGGTLKVRAEIVHGKLAVSVADTGLGFGRGATAGTGVGLANIRERLQLLYGTKAHLVVAENPGGGTVVTVTVPYKSLEGEHA